MSIIQLDSRIQMKKDTEANWTSNNPVLLDGETVISLQSDGTVRKKTGNGTSNYNQLNYDDEYALNNTTQQINTHNSSSNPHANMGWIDADYINGLNLMPKTGGTFTGIVKAAGEGYQAPGTSLLRNTKLVSSDTTPTVNGEINWTYG